VVDSCVLGLFASNLQILNESLQEEGREHDFRQLDLVLRGNYLVKKQWMDKLNTQS
jgi:hypothetical protein